MILKSYFEQITDILSVIRQIKTIEIIRHDLDELELKEILKWLEGMPTDSENLLQMAWCFF